MDNADIEKKLNLMLITPIENHLADLRSNIDHELYHYLFFEHSHNTSMLSRFRQSLEEQLKKDVE
jgi:hypothetical protein